MWDFKQRQNLLVAFLDEGCPLCEEFIRELCNHAARLREEEAATLLVFPNQPGKLPAEPLPEGMFAGVPADSDEILRFLGESAQAGRALSWRGIFVTDRYGEIAGLWIVQGHAFPPIDQIMTALDSVEIACEECTFPAWPIDE